jgi:Flp pilus assembly pilin Flp
MSRALQALLADDSAVTTVEYAILLCLIAAASVALWWSTLGDTMRECFAKSDAEMTAAGL